MPARAPGLARLWAPWRMAYIDAAATGKARRGRGRKAVPADPAPGAGPPCLFCRVRDSADDRGNLVLARRPRAMLMLNKYPYNPGHLMVAVMEHKAQFTDLDAAERRDVLELAALAEQALAAEYHPHGMNYGINVGRVAGAGFPGHLHMHFVPRWDGDTNFMPTVGETRVLPESLENTWRRLGRAIKRLGRRRPAARTPRGRGRIRGPLAR